MDDVVTDEEWNREARCSERRPLQLIDLRRSAIIENRSDETFLQRSREFGLIGHELRELPELFLERHPRQQLVHAILRLCREWDQDECDGESVPHADSLHPPTPRIS